MEAVAVPVADATVEGSGARLEGGGPGTAFGEQLRGEGRGDGGCKGEVRGAGGGRARGRGGTRPRRRPRRRRGRWQVGGAVEATASCGQRGVAEGVEGEEVRCGFHRKVIDDWPRGRGDSPNVCDGWGGWSPDLLLRAGRDEHARKLADVGGGLATLLCALILAGVCNAASGRDIT